MQPDPELVAETRAWLTKARTDLTTAAFDLTAEPPFAAADREVPAAGAVGGGEDHPLAAPARDRRDTQGARLLRRRRDERPRP